MTVLYTKDGLKIELDYSSADDPPSFKNKAAKEAIWFRTENGIWIKSNKDKKQTVDILLKNLYKKALSMLT